MQGQQGRKGRMRHRRKLTRMLAIPMFVVIAVTGSAWEDDHALVAGLLFFAGLILIACATVGRLWCSLYISGYKTGSLVSEGPYSICRNPLYFFTLVGTIGIGMTTETFAFPVLFAFAFAVYYPFVIRNEAQRLSGIHGEQFEAYRAKTPAFFPRPSLLREPEQYLTSPIIFRKSMFDVIWFIMAAGLIELLETIRELGYIPEVLTSY